MDTVMRQRLFSIFDSVTSTVCNSFFAVEIFRTVVIGSHRAQRFSIAFLFSFYARLYSSNKNQYANGSCNPVTQRKCINLFLKRLSPNKAVNLAEGPFKKLYRIERHRDERLFRRLISVYYSCFGFDISAHAYRRSIQPSSAARVCINFHRLRRWGSRVICTDSQSREIAVSGHWRTIIGIDMALNSFRFFPILMYLSRRYHSSSTFFSFISRLSFASLFTYCNFLLVTHTEFH